MKRHNLYFGLFCAALATMPACSDEFLDTQSKTESNTDTFYKTEADAEEALIGCYDGWQCTISSAGAGIYLASEFLGDHCFGAAGNGDARNWQVLDRFDQSESSSDVNIFETDWKNYYAAIYRCNELISRAGQINWTSDAVMGRVLGEACTIRAILYFDLARLFGGVPIFTEPVNENKPRSEASEVYKLIVEDLNYAIANIPATAYPVENNNTTDGRITKYAAEALLARVYLFYTGYYGTEPEGCTKAQALEGLEDVIANGGYELETNFADLWMAACTESAADEYSWITTYAGKYYNSDGWHAGQGQLSKEFILNMKFNSTQDYSGNNDGNCFQVYLGIRNVGVSPIAEGWGCCTVNPYFVNKFSGDPRLAASVVDVASIISSDQYATAMTDWREYTGYTVRKYAPLCFYDGTRESVGLTLGEQHKNITYYIDYTVMRYADVLLMAAELGSGNASSYLNQVHERAWGAGNTVALSQENIMKEREIEFAFEGLRYWDLLRQGVDVAASTIAEHQNGVKVISAGNDDMIVTSAGNITSKKGLQQIPSNQITLSNGVLTQNQGW